jgi:hypothetical protein
MSGDELARVLSGPFLAACALLATAGAAKLARPASALPAVRALRLPARVSTVRIVGAFELGAAIAGVVFGGIAAVAVAVAYVALSCAAYMLWRTAPSTPCGCLGASSTAPASPLHVVVDACAALVALAAAFGGSPLAVIADQPLFGFPFVVLTALAAGLASLLLDALPALRVAVRKGNA